MRLLSTSGEISPAPLSEALRRGLAPDGGLYMPEHMEPLPADFFTRLPGRGLVETATEVAQHLLGDADIGERELADIVAETLSFEIPLVRQSDRISVLELFHGPTLAFKDVGARFLARLLEHTRTGDQLLTVLVATSGDTGGAVAQAFHGVPGTRVAVLYPKGKVTPVQERQFTTLGGNIRAYAVAGTFDDCQRLVKGAFADSTLNDRMALSSANSISIGRLLPQMFYYFHAVAQLEPDADRTVLFCTPSGNFGNLTAGLMAKHLGLESRFIAATNVNDVVPEYLDSGIYQPRPSRRTLSNAMDVGDPSNMARIRHLYGDDLDGLRRDVTGFRVNDQTTQATIRRIHADLGYLCDPHTAVGIHALEHVLTTQPATTQGIVLSTAHPAKFREVVEPVIGRDVPLPRRLAARLEEPVQSIDLANDPDELKRQLLDWD